jgi:hypothetical protein
VLRRGFIREPHIRSGVARATTGPQGPAVWQLGNTTRHALFHVKHANSPTVARQCVGCRSRWFPVGTVLMDLLGKTSVAIGRCFT